MATSPGIINRIILYSLVIFLIGTLGAVYTGSDTASGETNYSSENGPSSTRTSRVDTELYGTIQLWDDYYNQEHDGVYGDGSPGDYYDYFLGTNNNHIRIYLKNIDVDGNLEDITTTFKTTSDSADLFTITNSDDFYSWIPSGSYARFDFDFDVENDGEMTIHEVELQIDYTYVDGTGGRSDHSGSIYFFIKTITRINAPSNGESLMLTGMNSNGNTISIYSGTQDKFLTFSSIRSFTGTLEDVRFDLSLPGFTLGGTTTTIDSIDTGYGNDEPLWELISAGSNTKEAKDHTGTLKITYDNNGQTITESKVPVVVTVVRTPFVNMVGQKAESEIGEKSGNEYLSNFQIYQGTTSETFSLKFKNDGNIDLKDVQVELFTDNAAYFFKSNFYYDESNQAYERSYGNYIEFGDIKYGQTVEKSFSTEVIKNLPPGLYKIPFTYTAKYNTGEFYDVTFDVYDYHSGIVSARSSDNDGYLPFLLLEVKEGDNADDKTEPDMMAMANTYLQPGMKSVQLPVELTNLENYRLNSVNVEIAAGGTSPIASYSSSNGSTMNIKAQEKDFTIYGANDMVYSNKQTVTFFVDINKNAPTGVTEVPITLTCLDPFNQERTTTVMLPLNINPIPPGFIVSDVTTTDIGANGQFTLTLKVYNCGGSDARNVQVMFNGSSNLFSAKEAIMGPKSVDMEEEAEFVFTIFTNEIEPGHMYTPSVIISFEDDIGNTYPFESGNAQTLNLRAKTEVIEPEEKFMDVTLGLALFILGIIILIGVIVFGMIQYKIAKLEYSGPKEKKEKDKRKKGKANILTEPSKVAPKPQQPYVQAQPSATTLPPPPPQPNYSDTQANVDWSPSPAPQPVPPPPGQPYPPQRPPQQPRHY